MTSEKKPLYKPFPYRGPNKFKYSVYVKCTRNKCGKKLIHFGHIDYQHYKDKGGYFSHLDHLDKTRRKRYRARASGIRDKYGNRTYKDKNSKNYWAYNYLW